LLPFLAKGALAEKDGWVMVFKGVSIVLMRARGQKGAAPVHTMALQYDHSQYAQAGAAVVHSSYYMSGANGSHSSLPGIAAACRRRAQSMNAAALLPQQHRTINSGNGDDAWEGERGCVVATLITVFLESFFTKNF